MLPTAVDNIAVAPFSRRVSPRRIIVLPALRASSSDWLGDLGTASSALAITSRTGHTAEHMGGSGSVSRSSSPKPSLFAKDGVSSMHAAYSIGKSDGVWLGTSVSKRPWANASNMGTRPSEIRYSTALRAIRPVQTSQPQPVTVVLVQSR